MGKIKQKTPPDIYSRVETFIPMLLLKSNQETGIWSIKLFRRTRTSPSPISGPKCFTKTNGEWQEGSNTWRPSCWDDSSHQFHKTELHKHRNLCLSCSLLSLQGSTQSWFIVSAQILTDWINETLSKYDQVNESWAVTISFKVCTQSLAPRN